MRISTTMAASAVYCLGSNSVNTLPAAETRISSASTSHLRAHTIRRNCLMDMMLAPP
jgi:hypothetical protein